MKPLNRSYWRLGWVLLTNGGLILLLLSSPIRVYQHRLPLIQLLGGTPPPLAWSHEFFAGPWSAIIVAILFAGILAEWRRTVLSAVFNVGFYLILLVLIIEALMAGAPGDAVPEDRLLFMFWAIIPLVTVINLVLYSIAFRRRKTQEQLGVPENPTNCHPESSL